MYQIKLNNSLTRKVEGFEPIDKNLVKMYSCGPTVYNYAHIGNMRSFLFADLLQRVLKTVGGYEVKWVMNLTNIDDKTIRDSSPGSEVWLDAMGKQSEDPHENLNKLTDYYSKSFVNDITKLGVNSKDFDSMPKATDYIESMQNLVRLILKKEIAYISNGSVYFSVSKWRKIDKYGKLFKVDFNNFREGVRIDADQYDREEVSDFVLWKAKKEGEPYWDFNIDGVNCPGRPGWHLECSAMEYELLGLPFDIHTGGIDLKFPHHEDEIAQSKAGYGIEPTAFWCHNEFLEVEGEKMSKSAGNFFTIRDLEDKGLDTLDIRYAMLSSHYASIYNFTFDGIKSAAKARLRVQDYIHGLFEKSTVEKSSIEKSTEIDVHKLKFDIFNSLAHDLHTPKALGNLFSFINSHSLETLSRSDKEDLLSVFSDLNEIFSVWEIKKKTDTKTAIPDEIIELCEKRLQAKKDKNWPEADSLRAKISEAGYAVKDTADSFIIEKV